MKTKITAVIIFSCLVFSCTRTLYMPASMDPAIQQQLMDGRDLYVVHCSSCHNLHLPKEYDSAGWARQLNEMQVKAKISDAEKQLILKYLIAHP
jgi:hypothetical protein